MREVWYWERGSVTLFVLRGETYAKVEASEALVGIDLVVLASFLDRPTTSAAIKAYRAAIQMTGR